MAGGGVDLERDVLGARDVAAEDRGAQAVFVVVRAGHRLLGVLHAQDVFDRAEGLLAMDAHPRRHMVEQRRGHQRGLGLAAAHELGVLEERVVDQRVAVAHGVHSDQLTQHHRLGLARVTERQALGLGNELVDEDVVHLGFDGAALGAHEDLAAVGENSEGRVGAGVVVRGGQAAWRGRRLHFTPTSHKLRSPRALPSNPLLTPRAS